MLFKQHELESDRSWSELFTVLTEDDSGHIRVSDEIALNEMYTSDFFIKLLIFKERLDKRLNK